MDRSGKRLYWRNLVIGGLLAIALHFLFPSGSQLILPLSNLAGDILNRFADSSAANGWLSRHQNVSGRLAPIIILNIDDEAYRAWGESSITPRDKLAGLMLFSLKAGAAVIVLDIDLSRPGGSKEHDAMLANLVTSEVSNAASQSRASKIILARRVVQDSESNQWIRKLYFESSMPDQGRSLQAGTTTFLVDNDQVVRRWQLAMTTCDRGVILFRVL